MCRWMGSHFNNWTDYKGVTFSIELLELGSTFSGFWGKEYSGARIFTTSSLTNVPIHFRMTLIKGFIR